MIQGIAAGAMVGIRGAASRIGGGVMRTLSTSHSSTSSHTVTFNHETGDAIVGNNRIVNSVTRDWDLGKRIGGYAVAGLAWDVYSTTKNKQAERNRR